MKIKPKAPTKKTLLKQTGSSNTYTSRKPSRDTGLNSEETDYLNRMLKKFGDLDEALDAVKAKYGHTGRF